MPQKSEVMSNVSEMSGEFLTRLGSDPGFAQSYDKDPAAALQDLFPALKFVSKTKIITELDAGNKSLDRLTAIVANDVDSVPQGGFIEMSGEFLTRLGSDPGFAQSYDKDPAAALQDLFPALKFVSKTKIITELDAGNKSLDRLIAIGANDVDSVPQGGFIERVKNFVRSVAKIICKGP